MYNAINGNLGGVPVYEEKRLVSSSASTFVLLSTQQQTPTEENDCTWISRSMIDIEVIQKTGSEVTKNTVDDISNTILGILLPLPGATGLTSSNIQFGYSYCESIISRNLSFSETESVIQKVIRVVFTTVQQS